jgi:hypothetical protein
MITVKIKKLFQGKIASVRDYLVGECISKGLTLRVIYRGRFMDLSPEELRSKSFQMTKGTFNSKFNKQKYQLLDFYWKPAN